MEVSTLDIIGLLHGLGISSKLKGFGYLVDIISNIIINNLDTFKMNEMYELLSHKYGSSCVTITKCVRESIEKSWNNGDIELIDKIFGYSLGYENKSPGNALFVNSVVDYLKHVVKN